VFCQWGNKSLLSCSSPIGTVRAIATLLRTRGYCSWWQCGGHWVCKRWQV
jgi:hypothetical protein